jgi:malate dehydrogenase (oxaloacetate-decarboxylating)
MNESQPKPSGEATVKYSDLDVLNYHSNNFPGNGKLETIAKTSVNSALDLTLAYSPGVAIACLAIEKNPPSLYDYTNIGNTVAVISNGTRVLGLGDIGLAGYPVMEGKSILFKALANVDSFPFILNTKDPDEFIRTVEVIAQNFGGINLEDIRNPDCFYIERELIKRLDVPVFHDDQWGTAIVTLAGLINSLKLVDKRIQDIKVTLNGAGASGLAIAKMLLEAGVKGENMHLVDRDGTIYTGRGRGMNPYKEEIAERINPRKEFYQLEHVTEGIDVLIGVSTRDAFKPDMIKKMADDPIVFALANPVPEILPQEAINAGAKIVATGRSDFNNQINNVLGFPGIFRGALDVKAKSITDSMKVAAAEAIASVTDENELSFDNIITHPTDPRLMPKSAAAVSQAAIADGVARQKKSYEEVFELTKLRIEYYN